MNQQASVIYIQESNYFLEIYLDPFNKRIRVDDYRGSVKFLLHKAEELAHQHHAEKLIIKARAEDFLALYERGFQPEAVVDRFFLGPMLTFFRNTIPQNERK